MHENKVKAENSDDLASSRLYCLRLIEFISSLGTDPHLYFQHKLAADVSSAENLADLMSLLSQLIDWVESADLRSSQTIKLDKILTAEELPSFTLMRNSAKPESRRILAMGRVATEQEYCLIRDSVLCTQEISNIDRKFIERLLNTYESTW